ncbi:MAG: HpcH/HpaI aldolase/citrate lyase family protein [Betaproteobacteria bacterium]
MRPFRSLLFVPGTRADRFEKALASGADAVVFDLEDSVEPTQKARARERVGEFLAATPAGSVLRFVRVNAARSATWAAELEFFARHRAFDAIVLPKAASAAIVEEVAHTIDTPVLPLLETAQGILHAAAIAAASAVVPALLFGAEDLTAELGITRTIDGEELALARSTVVLAAAAAGADAIDAVFVDLNDADGLRRDCLRARAVGFHGKMAIHPAQLEVIHDVFTPGAAEIALARRIVAAYEEAQAGGEGVIRLEGRMVDVPVVERARRILGRAR